MFTDRDSRPPPLDEWAAYRYWLVHLHGDNYWLHRDPAGGRVAYTSQAYCLWPVIGTGAFTDGDRPVALAMALGADEIVLYGYDTGGPVCTHKLSGGCRWKRVKLQAAWLALGLLAREYGYELEVRGDELAFIHR